MTKDTFEVLRPSEVRRKANGLHFTNKVLQCTGSDLTRVLGEPTYRGSDDDKVRLEWIIEYNAYDEMDNELSAIISIYDWKTNPSFDLDSNLYDWHIGSKNFNASTIDYFIEDMLISMHG